MSPHSHRPGKRFNPVWFLTTAAQAEKGVARMHRFLSRYFRRSGLGPALATLLLAACLPDPEIKVPDFKPSGILDLGQRPSDLTVPVDGGRVRWSPDGPVPTGQTLRAIYVDSSGQIFVAGHGGVILRRSGNSWSTEQALDGAAAITSNFYGLAGSGSDLYAVGEAGVVVKRTGDKWLREGKALAVTASLFAVTIAPSGDVYAVGDLGTVLRKPMGGSFGKDTVGAALSMAEFRAVAVSKPDQLTAVGLGAVVAVRSGTGWNEDTLTIDSADRANFYGVAATSEAVFVVGDSNRVLRRDADKWRREATGNFTGPGSNLYAIVASGQDLIVAGATGLIERRSAPTKTWTSEDSGTTVMLGALSNATPLRAVGAQGTMVVQK